MFYLLEAAGFETWLVNAKDVRHLPGRPKTDKLDAVWLCKVAERQMLRPSFVPPAQIRRLRDLTRYRADLVAAPRSCPARPAHHAPEDHRAGRSFTGYFTDHHAFLLGTMLARVDAISADIAALDTRIDQVISPFADAVARLDEIPGISLTAACVIIAETGLDMTRFPTAGHLASRARFAPGVTESAGKKKGKGSAGHGNPYLAAVLGNAAAAAGRTDTFLGERYLKCPEASGQSIQ